MLKSGLSAMSVSVPASSQLRARALRVASLEGTTAWPATSTNGTSSAVVQTPVSRIPVCRKLFKLQPSATLLMASDFVPKTL